MRIEINNGRAIIVILNLGLRKLIVKWLDKDGAIERVEHIHAKDIVMMLNYYMSDLKEKEETK